MTNVELSYLAGIVDGEGSIMFVKLHSCGLPSPVLSICNTNKALLEWIQCRFGGKLTPKKPRKKEHKLSYDLRWCYDDCLRVISQIAEYLVIKKPQAMILINEYKMLTPRNGKYTADVLCKKMALIQRLKDLNKRGAPLCERGNDAENNTFSNGTH